MAENIAIQVLLTAKDQASGTLKNVGSSLEGVGNSFKNFKQDLLVASAGITAAGWAINGLVSDAGKFESVKDAFTGMTKDMISSTDGFVAAVQGAAQGTLSQMDVLQNGTRALSLIGKEAFTDFQGEFSKAAELTQKAAVATGQDMDYLFNSLVTGVSRGSKLILDNLGITVDMADAQSKYADELMKTNGLTEAAAQKASLWKVVLEQLGSTYEGVAINTDSLAVKQAQLEAGFRDLKVAVGEALSPLQEQFIKSFAEPFINEWGPQIKESLQGVVDEFTKLPEPIQQGVMAALLFIPALAAIGVVLIPLKATFGVFAALLTGVVAPAIGVVAAALGIGPGALAALIIGLISLAVLLWKNWDVLAINIKSITQNLVAHAKLYWEIFKNEIKQKWDAVTSIIKGAVDSWRAKLQGFMDFIGNVKNAVEGLINKFREWLNLSGGGGGGGGFSFASGGVVPGPVGAPTMAMVHGGEEVIPVNRVSGDGGGGGGGASVTFNIHIGMYAGSEIEKRNIAEELYRSLVRTAQAQNLTVSGLMGA